VIYFDTSYLLKCYLAEPGSAQVLALAQSNPGRACAVHGRLEFWSGVKRHVREGNLSQRQAAMVFRQFVRDEAAQLWHFLPLPASLIQSACSQLESLPDGIPCRAADALHLACAAHHGFAAIYSNDRHLLAAAPNFGIQGINVIP
jgi:predicted nucleic acid-binding protein